MIDALFHYYLQLTVLTNQDYDPSWRIINEHYENRHLSSAQLEEAIRRGVQGFSTLFCTNNAKRCKCDALIHLEYRKIHILPKAHEEWLTVAIINEYVRPAITEGHERPKSAKDVEQETEIRRVNWLANIGPKPTPFIYFALILDKENYAPDMFSEQQILQDLINNFEDSSKCVEFYVGKSMGTCTLKINHHHLAGVLPSSLTMAASTGTKRIIQIANIYTDEDNLNKLEAKIVVRTAKHKYHAIDHVINVVP